MGIFTKILGGLGGSIVETVGGVIQRKQERKARELELEKAIQIKKIENVQAGKIAEVEWNKASINKAGWRPGYLTVILSLPLILVFIPWFVPYIKVGFSVLDQTPLWYRSAIAVMISSAFGIKKYADYAMNKKFTIGDSK